MKKTMRILALVMAVAMVAVCCAACGEQPGKTETDKTKESTKVYSFVADNSFAPFDFLDEKTQSYTGIDMDILAAIAEDQGFKYNMDNCGWNAALGNLGSGQADAMIAGMTITDERKETYDFSDTYFEDGQIMFTTKDSAITSPEDLKGKKLAVKTGTQGAEYANSVKDQYGFTIESFDGSDNVYAAVQAGNVDAGIEDFSVINYKISSAGLNFKTIGEKVNIGPYGIAVLKGTHAELIDMLNKGLANIKANGKYEEILAKYGM